MVKRMFASMICIVFLSVCAYSFAEEVYVTKNGKKYHSADCIFIKDRAVQKISKEEAMKKGLKPCGKCLSDDSASLSNKDPKAITEKK